MAEVEDGRPPSIWDVPQITTDDLDVEGKGAPIYKVSDVARWFLGKTSHWLRWAERRGFLTDPATNEIVGGRSEPPNNARDRKSVV